MRVVQILIYVPLNCFGYQPFKPILSFSKCLDHLMKHLEGTQAHGQNFFKIHGFSPREYFPLYKPTRCVPAQRVWFLHLFVLKMVRTWRTGWHTPTKTPREHPPPPPPRDFSHFRVVNNTNKRPRFKY